MLPNGEASSCSFGSSVSTAGLLLLAIVSGRIFFSFLQLQVRHGTKVLHLYDKLNVMRREREEGRREIRERTEGKEGGEKGEGKYCME